MRSVIFVFFSAVLVSLLVNCKEEMTVAHEEIVGNWIVYAAQRNGKPTELLNGAVFEFGDSTMATDFTGFKKFGRYTLVDGVVVHHGEVETKYEINILRADTMNLQTSVEGLRLLLQLARDSDQ